MFYDPVRLRPIARFSTPDPWSGNQLTDYSITDYVLMPIGSKRPDISEHYARAPQPKQLIVLEGSAHAQFLFATDQGPRLFREIESFLGGR